ncbi:AMP-binding protein [Vibrio ponticus]|nr:AMP-binding protein [Vibrio ponticus]
MSKHNIYHIGLEKTPANYESLSPLSFLERAASVYPNYTATVHGDIHKTWRETETRCRKLASALQKQGIGEGDTVSVIAPNLPEVFEMHFGVPMSGAVLNAINTRLDADAIAFIFQHAESKVVIVDKEFTEVVKKALKMIAHRPIVISIDDPLYSEGELISELTYEEFILDGDPEYQYWPPSDEWQAISLNYTSGTTGNRKGWCIITVARILMR